MFDTLLFEPIKCSICGIEIKELQVKFLDNCLLYFKVGDIINSEIITGIMKDTLYCSKCKKDTYDIYLAIKNQIFLGVFLTEDEAQKEINNFGTGDLYLHYKNALKERNNLQRKLYYISGLIYDYKYMLEHKNDEKKDIFKSIAAIRLGVNAPKENVIEILDFLYEETQKEIKKIDVGDIFFW
jgi:hypothetical protein